MSARQSRRETREQEAREQLMAIEEEMLVAWRAREQPSLATYLTRFPQFAEEMLAFVVEHLDVVTDASDDALRAQQHTPLPPGMRAALERIGAMDGEWRASADGQPPLRRRVAEEEASYVADAANSTTPAGTEEASTVPSADEGNRAE